MLQSNIAIVLRDLGKLNEAIAPLRAATETMRLQAAQLDYSPEAYLPVALNHYELLLHSSNLKVGRRLRRHSMTAMRSLVKYWPKTPISHLRGGICWTHCMDD